MHELHSQIEIDATPEEVWRVLVDVERYHEWNPFIVDVHGVVQHGARLRLVMHPPGGRAVTLKPAVTQVQPKQVFEWWGHLVVRGLFDGRHRFELEPTARGTRVRADRDVHRHPRPAAPPEPRHAHRGRVRADEPRTEGAGRTGPGHRGSLMAAKHGLQAYQVVEAAATLADREGLERVTLAGVAAALGVRSPSLYSHVEGLAGLRRALGARGRGPPRVDAWPARCGTGMAWMRSARSCHAYRGFAAEHRGLYATLLDDADAGGRRGAVRGLRGRHVPAIGRCSRASASRMPTSSLSCARSRARCTASSRLEASRASACRVTSTARSPSCVDVVIAGIVSRR